MSLPWLLALKVIPWGDVIEHAPKVLSAARKLLERQRSEPPIARSSSVIDLPGDAPPSLGEIKNRLIAAQLQIDRQAQEQDQLTQTLAELAEQNARLVSAVDLLRKRLRLLLAALLLLLPWLVWLSWR